MMFVLPLAFLGPVLLVFLVVGGGLLLVVVGIYNGLVRARNGVENAWQQIDVQLKRRFDLIPNLMETVKGYMTHEREVLEGVTAARNMVQAAGQGTGGGDRAAQIEAQGALTGALGRLIAVAENYPDLKASANFAELQEELASTENKVAFSRQFYNDSVMSYDNKREQFPAVIFAGMFGFKEEPYWKIEEASEREAPKVSFS
jgi:LemA protein